MGFSTIATRFDEAKTAAAATVLLNQASGAMEYMRLLKLLYMADRLSWAKLGRPITGDNYVSMDQGPVLSKTYNLIKSEGESAEDEARPWQQTVERASRYEVRLRQAADLGPLSAAEIGMLEQVYSEYGKMPLWTLVRHLHKKLPEWSNPKGSCIDIFPETILSALGLSDEQVEEVRREATERIHFERLLGTR